MRAYHRSKSRRQARLEIEDVHVEMETQDRDDHLDWLQPTINYLTRMKACA